MGQSVCVTRDNSRHAPTNGVVEPHGPEVDVALLGLHAVGMKTLHEHPGKRGHEEIMQQDGNDGAQELEERKKTDYCEGWRRERMEHKRREVKANTEVRQQDEKQNMMT